MTINKLIAISALGAAAAFAQSWSQPVREIEKEARSAVTGFCSNIDISPGFSGSGIVQCSFFSIMPGSPALNQVPAGKILVIEDLSGSCTKPATDSFSQVAFSVAGRSKLVPLILLSTFANGTIQKWIASASVRLYAPPQSTATASVSLNTNTTGLVGCGLNFTGHLVSVQ